MKFDRKLAVDLREILANPDLYRAHSREGEEEWESLEAHLDLTLAYGQKIYEDKGLAQVFVRIYEELFPQAQVQEIFLKLLINTFYFHDLGKINPRFQREKMKQRDLDEDVFFQDSHHSKYGAWIYVDWFLREIYEEIDQRSDLGAREEAVLCRLLLTNAGIIHAHHGKMKSASSLKKIFRQENEDFSQAQYFKDHYLGLGRGPAHDHLPLGDMGSGNKQINQVFYIYSRLVYGLLTQADILATMDFTKGIKTNDLGLLSPSDKVRLVETYQNQELTKKIRAYERGDVSYGADDINELRSQMFLEAEKNLETSSNIYQLEAPTGAGKTNISINLALNLLQVNSELNKVFYAFPFNTLVEQTYASLKQVFGQDPEVDKLLSIYNSINSFENFEEILEKKKTSLESTGNPGHGEEDLEELAFDLLYRDYQFLYTPLVVSTNIKLFDILFGNQKASYFPLPLLANSVLILDEIQAYKNSIWIEIMEMLALYSRLLNIKIIIMSATLPDIGGILSLSDLNQDQDQDQESYNQRLIEEPAIYYQDPRFRERVVLNFDLLEIPYRREADYQEEIFEQIYQRIMAHLEEGDGQKVLVEFIKKKSARAFRKYLVEKLENQSIQVELMTGDTNKQKRKDLIGRLRQPLERQDLILVATQVIEAGVDIDMDLGFKNISLLDAEEQFLGRLNRSFKKDHAVAYFFLLDPPEIIYRHDVRTEDRHLLTQARMQELLSQKNFKEYYKDYVLLELDRRRKSGAINQGYWEYTNIFKDMDYDRIAHYFRLIEDQDKVTIFLGQTPEGDGSEVWASYLEILHSKVSLSQKKLRLLGLRSKMDAYLFEIQKKPSTYQSYAGGIYYIKSGLDYFDQGEFDPSRLEEDKDDFEFIEE